MDGRHHRVSREIIFVEVPVGGSPKEAHRHRPGPYKRDQLGHWRPATRPPNKAEKLARFLDSIRRQDEIVREFKRPDLALLKARWSIAA
jgi:hypothetical protein